jgi:hypothetical protein
MSKVDFADDEARLMAAVDAASNELSRINARWQKRVPLSDADKAQYRDEFVAPMKRCGEANQKLADFWAT